MSADFVIQIIVELIRTFLIEGLVERVRTMALMGRPRGMQAVRRHIHKTVRRRLLYRLSTE
jgi:succinylglutamate desuccinylase